MTRYRSRAAESLNTRLAHAQTCVEWRAPAITMPAPEDRATLLRRKAELEEAAAGLALRIAVWGDAAAVAAFDEIRTELKVIERDVQIHRARGIWLIKRPLQALSHISWHYTIPSGKARGVSRPRRCEPRRV